MADLDYRAMCEELLAWAERTSSHYYKQPDVLARARALLAQPVAEGPTVMEIIELHSWLEDEWRANNDGEDLPTLDFARAVLARFSHPTPQPVAVKERLPGLEDCIFPTGECWWFDPHADGAWYIDHYQGNYTHWLPSNALPTPEATND